MILLEDSDGVHLYDRDGELRYYVEDYEQIKKFNENSVCLITSDSVVFASETKIDGVYYVTIDVDTNFDCAYIFNGLIYIKRNYLIPVLDIYNSNLANVIRLHKTFSDSWTLLQTVLRVPYRAIYPIALKGKSLFCKKGKKYLSYNIENRKTQIVKEDEIPNRFVESALLRIKDSEVQG